MLAETMIKIILKKSNLETPRIYVLRNLLELHNKVKSSTVTLGYDVGVTNMIEVHRVIMKPLRGQSNQ